MAHLNWNGQAIADLTNIAEFIRKDSAKYARVTRLALSNLAGHKAARYD